MKALQKYFKEERGRQSRMAERLGLSHGFLSQIASGDRNPGVNTLLGISEVSGISVDVLLGLEPPEKRKARA